MDKLIESASLAAITFFGFVILVAIGFFFIMALRVVLKKPENNTINFDKFELR